MLRLLAASQVLGVDSGVWTAGGVGTILVGILSYLIKELSKTSGGVWKVVQEKNRTIHRQAWESRVKDWRIASLETELRICRGLIPADTRPDIEHPGPYIAPTKEELETW